MSAARQETFESRGDRSLHIPSFQLEVCGRGREKIGAGPPAFTVVFATSEVKQEALAGDLYQTVLAYVRGDIQVTGDVFAAIRLFTSQARHGWRQAYHLLLGRFAGLGIETWWQSRRRAAENVRRHYDRSNEFYRSFLDRGMTYSCAYFRNPAWGIEEAQRAKVEYILRKLDMHPGERFLDIGCGWGALLEAAARGGAIATGCTLSHAQYEWAQRRLLEFGTRARVLELDYRELTGQWDKIASVGMFEHVGRRRLTAYFRKVHGLLTADGLFLNHGLVRPQKIRRGVESVILRRMVFPGRRKCAAGDGFVPTAAADFRSPPSIERRHAPAPPAPAPEARAAVATAFEVPWPTPAAGRAPRGAPAVWCARDGPLSRGRLSWKHRRQTLGSCYLLSAPSAAVS